MVGYFTSPSFYTMSILAVPASHGWRDTKILSAEGWVCCRRCTKVWVSSHLPIQGLVWTLTSFFQGSEEYTWLRCLWVFLHVWFPCLG